GSTAVPSRRFRNEFGHTPFSTEEEFRGVPLPGHRHRHRTVMEEVKREAKRRKIELLILPKARLSRSSNKGLIKPTRSCTSLANKEPRRRIFEFLACAWHHCPRLYSGLESGRRTFLYATSIGDFDLHSTTLFRTWN